MISVQDLHIENEIKPLFDFTHNKYSGDEVKNILANVLASKEEILSRQQLLKGFLANHEIFKEYSFYRFDLTEVYDFLETIFIGSVTTKSLRLRFMFSEKEREKKRGKLILMIRLFYSIQNDYLSKIDTGLFPAGYATELAQMKDFLSAFNLDRYYTAFNKNKFRTGHIVELMIIVIQKTGNGEMASFWKQWFLFEAYLSISRGITSHGFVFPEFDDENFLLEGFYHPVLKNPVKNNIVAHRKVILLTGPNMSGKSTLLKAVSLCVYLAHTGLAAPASKAVMPFFKTISVAINLTDSLVSGYSHFMSEIITLKNVLKEAENDNRCFAVFDELFRGTNIEDALEISTLTLKGLTRFPNSLFLISTHLHQLKNMEEIRSHQITTCFIECIMKDNVPSFTYKLKEGWGDLKLGRILFEKEGLNHLLDRF
jgi:DNA mismatch repair protein MutS